MVVVDSVVKLSYEFTSDFQLNNFSFSKSSRYLSFSVTNGVFEFSRCAFAAVFEWETQKKSGCVRKRGGTRMTENVHG